MRRDPGAQLLIYCNTCGNKYNEYNWTLESAGSGPDDRPPQITFLKMLYEAAHGSAAYDDVFIYCPGCHERFRFGLLKKPALDELEAYLARVGHEYMEAVY